MNTLQKNTRTIFLRIEEISFKIMKTVTIFCLLGLLILVTLQVVARFLPAIIEPVSDDIIQLLNVWMIFLGAALIARSDGHVKIELLEDLLKNKEEAKLYLDLVTQLLVMTFLLFMVRSGVDMFRVSLTRKTPMLNLPQKWWYLPLPLSGVLMLFYTVVKIVEIITLIFKGGKEENENS